MMFVMVIVMMFSRNFVSVKIFDFLCDDDAGTTCPNEVRVKVENCSLKIFDFLGVCDDDDDGDHDFLGDDDITSKKLSTLR